MSSNVLDLIDNVVADHELQSADAMRWAPDAPDPTPKHKNMDPGPTDGSAYVLPAEVWDRAIVDEANTWLAHHGHPLTDWQYELVGRIFKVPVQMLLSRAEVERRVRLRRMHSDYHRRTRRRNRGR